MISQNLGVPTQSELNADLSPNQRIYGIPDISNVPRLSTLQATNGLRKIWDLQLWIIGCEFKMFGQSWVSLNCLSPAWENAGQKEKTATSPKTLRSIGCKYTIFSSSWTLHQFRFMTPLKFRIKLPFKTDNKVMDSFFTNAICSLPI